MRTTATSSKRAHARTSAALQRPPLTQASPGDSCTLPGKSGSVSCGVTAPFSWVQVHKVLLCPPRVYFPVLCKFRRLCGGVNGDLLQEGLCRTQVCCTQSPCPCGRPLLTCSSAADTQTQFWLSLCGVPGSWCAQSMFEPSECLWQEWGLILNVNLPLLSSCWGSPLPLDVAYLLTATPVPIVLPGFF